MYIVCTHSVFLALPLNHTSIPTCDMPEVLKSCICMLLWSFA